MSAVTKNEPPIAPGCFLDQQQGSYQSNQATNSNELIEINSMAQAASDLITRYMQSPILLEECVHQARLLIPGLTSHSSENLYAAMEGFFSLLNLEQVEFQQQLLKRLIPLLHANFPLKDLNSRLYFQLMGLETTLGQLIENHIRSGRSIKTLILLLTLYQDILEHLWLLPCLQTSETEIFFIDEKFTLPIKCRAESWALLLKCEKQENKKLENCLTTISELLSELMRVSTTSLVLDIFKTKKWPFNPVISSKKEILAALAKLYFSFQLYLRATAYYLEILTTPYINEINEAELTNHKMSLGKIYLELKESEKALEQFKDCIMLAEALNNPERSELRVRATSGIGIAYFQQDHFEESVKWFLKELETTFDLKDRSFQGAYYYYLGTSHLHLKKYDLAKDYLIKSLDFLELIPKLKKFIFHNLGRIYYNLKDFLTAINFYLQFFELSKEPSIKPTLLEASAYQELGNIYSLLKIWVKAEYCYKQNIKIAQKYGDLEQQFFSLKIIGIMSFDVGDHKRADKYWLECLKTTRDPAQKQSVYQCLAQNCINLKKFEEAEKYFKLIQDYAGNNPEELALLYNAQGRSCFAQKKYREALDWHQKSLASCSEIEDPPNLQSTYSNIGNALAKLGCFSESIKAHLESIKIADKHNDPFGKTVGMCNIGVIHLLMGKFPAAEQFFRHSIQVSSSIQQSLVEKREWQITSFEIHAKPYIGLEKALIQQGKSEAALQVVESRQAQALNFALAKNLNLAVDYDKVLSIQEIQALAKDFHTTFVIYSLHVGFAWIISSTRFEAVALDTDGIHTEIENITGVLEKFPFRRSPGSAAEIPLIAHLQKLRGNPQADEALSHVRKELKKDLSRWYEALILPLEDYLPKDEQESLTFVPDGFLSQIPFGLFIDFEDKYLIEKHPIAFIPSLKTLCLLAKKEPTNSLKNAVVMGNPNTGDIADDLDHSQKEAEALGKLFELSEQQILLREQATSEHIIEKMLEANLIFISCHGLGGKESLVYNHDSIDPSAVFEGCLKLAPDQDHPKGYLSSKEISELKLTQAEFVCLSSCFSGTGSLWQEGSIGFVSAFLAAGAKTIMAAHWPVRDSEITVSMIEKMAKNMIEPKGSRLTHQHALQCIMKEMIAKYPKQIEEWGVFFLTGIN